MRVIQAVPLVKERKGMPKSRAMNTVGEFARGQIALPTTQQPLIGNRNLARHPTLLVVEEVVREQESV